MAKIFKASFFKNFWDESDYTYRDYTGPAITKEQIAEAEKALGYKLPQSYIELLENKNGGVPKNDCFPSKKKTSWADDHIAISGIHGINKHTYSLLGGTGSRFMMEEWGYPDIGIVICNCPSAGHDAIMLDYRKCKKDGEPIVVHVDVEGDKPKITKLADNFEAFVRGLVNESVYAPPADEELKDELEKVESGSFSPVLVKAFQIVGDKIPDADQKLRLLGKEVVKAKKGFYLHGDELSHLVYDYLFWLFCHIQKPKSRKDYLEQKDKLQPPSYNQPYYSLMVALSADDQKYGFCTGGYSADFVRDWWNDRLVRNDLIETETGFELSKLAEARMFKAIADLDKDIVPDSIYTPAPPSLFEAVKSGKEAMFRYELTKGTKLDTNERDRNGMTMLHFAALYGLADLCKTLLDHGADPNAKSNFGATAYQCAVKSKDAVTCKTLIDAGAEKE